MDSGANPLKLRLFGGFELRSTQGADAAPLGRKVRALLAYLALSPDRLASLTDCRFGDGLKVHLYETFDEKGEFYVVATQEREDFVHTLVMKLTGKTFRALSWPAWSPDGKRFVHGRCDALNHYDTAQIVRPVDGDLRIEATIDLPCEARNCAFAWQSATSLTTTCHAAGRPAADDESFDLVLGHAVLHHIPDLDRAFAEFKRVLRPGGSIVFAGEPSRYGDRLAALPKRTGLLVAPAWRRAVGAHERLVAEADQSEGHSLESEVEGSVAGASVSSPLPPLSSHAAEPTTTISVARPARPARRRRIPRARASTASCACVVPSEVVAISGARLRMARPRSSSDGSKSLMIALPRATA